jgi:sodium/potassium/calcium exchanger 6
MTMPSFSLLGALEFRSVISSLQEEAAGSTLEAFEPLLTPYPGGHYHSFGRSRSRSHGSIRSGSPQLSDSSSDVPLNDRSPFPSRLLPVDDSGSSLREPLITTDSDAGPQIPQIVHTPASPSSETNMDLVHHTPPTRRQRIRRVLTHALHILFPTLHEFHKKSLLGKVAAVFAAPAVFMLTVTLPVVVRSYDSPSYRHEKTPSVVIHTLSVDDGIERTLVAEEEVLEEMQELQFNKWLMAVQCVFGPVFCAAVLFSTLVYLGLFSDMKGSEILCRGFCT